MNMLGYGKTMKNHTEQNDLLTYNVNDAVVTNSNNCNT